MAMMRSLLSKSTALLVLLLFALLGIYLTLRLYYLAASPYPFGMRLFGIVFLVAEFFVLFHGFGYFTNVLVRQYTSPPAVPTPLEKEPRVAILIPARHEPRAVLASTILACRNLGYRNKKIYLLDDSTTPSYKEEARAIAEEFNVALFTRPDNRGAKAGMLNEALKGIEADYIAVFDADQNPMPGFLLKTVPLLEADTGLALVQTPQFYTNTESSRVAWASNVQQAVFFEYISEGKSAKGGMFCCGTNFVMRKAALDEVGGFEEGSVTEDVATTLKLHSRGWKSLYFPEAWTFGMAPESLASYFTQQNRWAMGSAQMLRRLLTLLRREPGSLKPLQWFEYLLSSSYYFVGWAYLVLLAAPVLFVFFDFPSYFMDPALFVVSFVPYFVLSVLLFYSGLERRHYSPFNLIKGQMLAMLSIPVYMRAVTLGVLNIKRPFQVTPKEGGSHLLYRLLLPQLLLLVLHLSALVWGVMRMYYEQNAALAINLFWIAYHLFLFGGLFYFNEES